MYRTAQTDTLCRSGSGGGRTPGQDGAFRRWPSDERRRSTGFPRAASIGRRCQSSAASDITDGLVASVLEQLRSGPLVESRPDAKEFLSATMTSWAQADRQWDGAVAKLAPQGALLTMVPELDNMRLEMYRRTFYPALQEMLQRLEEDDSFAEQLLDSLYLSLRGSKVAWRAFSKPSGYAGDFKMIDLIHNPHTLYQDTLSGWCLDKWCLDSGSCQAVSLRRAYLKAKIDEVVAGAQGTANVLCLASGPAAEICDWMQVQECTNPNVHFWCLEHDKDAIAFAEQRFAEAVVQREVSAVDTALQQAQQAQQPMSTAAPCHRVVVQPPKHIPEPATHLTSIKGNVLFASRGRCADPKFKELKEGSMDLIYSAGVVDYLNQGAIQAIAEWAFKLLKPGGRLVLGNFNAAHPGIKAFSHKILGWILNWRSEQDLIDILQPSAFGKAGCNITVEQGGHPTQLMVVATKQAAPTAAPATAEALAAQLALLREVPLAMAS